MAGRGHQRTGLFDRGRGIRLVAELFAELFPGCGEFRERINKPADHHRRHVLDDIDQDGLVQGQVQGAADPLIIERFSLVVHPGRLDHALVVVGSRHPRGCLGFPGRDWIHRADIIDPTR
jgi:hypothetical protein